MPFTDVGSEGLRLNSAKVLTFPFDQFAGITSIHHTNFLLFLSMVNGGSYVLKLGVGTDLHPSLVLIAVALTKRQQIET